MVSCPSRRSRVSISEAGTSRSLGPRIQDVIKEGQELLVQVEKEERGNKERRPDHLRLAGRPLSGPDAQQPAWRWRFRRVEGDERAELKEAMDQLEYPKGMSLIARTAGIGRTQAEELQWDLNYLLKLWTAIDGAAQLARAPS